MKKCVKIFAMLASAATLFTGCLESSSSNEATLEKLSIKSVKSLSALPTCDNNNVGEEIYVEKEEASYVCVNKKWLASATVNTHNVKVSTSCTTEGVADGSGVKIVCGGDSVGVVLNGARGDQGAQGKKGESGQPGTDGKAGEKGDKGDRGDRGETGDSGKNGENGDTGAKGDPGAGCTVETLTDNSGLKLICGGDSVGVVLNGKNGKNGKDGIPGEPGEPGRSCVMETLEDGTGLRVLCGGDTSAVILNGIDGFSGTNGENGTSCTVKQLKDKSGYKLLCDGDSVGVIKNGTNGENGTDAKNGTSCTVEKLESDGYKILCAGDSVGVIRNGEKGTDGLDAKDGVSCTVAQLKDESGYKILCDGDSVGVVKNGKNAENGTDGRDGDSCTVAELKDKSGFKVLCGHDSVGVVKNGYNGYNCETTPLGDNSGYKVECNGDSIGVILNGYSGINCTMEPLENGLGLKVMCGGDSVDVLLNTLGTCTEWREGILETVNSVDYACSEGDWIALSACASGNVGVVELYGAHYYTCTAGGWVSSTPVEYDTYGVACSKEGTVKAGKVNKKVYYYCNGTAWREATDIEYDTNGKVCDTDAKGTVVVGKVNKNAYYYCTGSKWRVATELEYATYGFPTDTTDGALKKSDVNGMVYLFDKNKWRVPTYVEEHLGGCTGARVGEVSNITSTYYICASRKWYVAEPAEYDVYLQDCPEDGSKNGRVIRGNVIDSAFYYCYNGTWSTATLLQRNTYDFEKDAVRECSEDGALFAGTIIDSLIYVCDEGGFRLATAREKELNLGCTNYNDGLTREDHYGNFWYTENLCADGVWQVTSYKQEENPPYGTLEDERDGKTYRTVTIGEGARKQTWMAENLNYADSSKTGSRSLKGPRIFCYNDDELNCEKYGHLYTWAAVMDSVNTGCGSTGCQLEHPIQGICPEGWHVPTNNEWDMLIANMGSLKSPTKWYKTLVETYGAQFGGRYLKSTSDDWESVLNYGVVYRDSIRGLDAFGFAALPAGYKTSNGYSSLGGRTVFWTASQRDASYGEAYYVQLYYEYPWVERWTYDPKKNAYSVRCVMNEE